MGVESTEVREEKGVGGFDWDGHLGEGAEVWWGYILADDVGFADAVDVGWRVGTSASLSASSSGCRVTAPPCSSRSRKAGGRVWVPWQAKL